MTRSYLAIGLCFALLGCGGDSAQTRENASRDIAAVLDSQVAAWNAGNIEGYMQGYWKSDSVRFVSGRGITSGWRNTLERYRKGYPSRDTMGELRFDDVDIEVLDAGSAVVLGRWELRREQDTPWGYFMLLMKRKAQGWCVVMDHTSSAGT